jgi:hypothetical protein
MKTTTLPLRNSISRSPLRLTFLLIPLVLGCFALSPVARAKDKTNTSVGVNALLSLTTGMGNTALGFEALQFNTTGSYSTATGDSALLNNNADFNTADGTTALYLNTTGVGNTATGALALYSNVSGKFNTADGEDALESNTGDQNTAVGSLALGNNSSGSNNIGIGFLAGFNLNGGANNVFIGNVGPVPIGSESNTIRIGTQTATTVPPSYAIPAHTATYIAGIYGETFDSGTGAAVSIDSTGKLGTTASAQRFKKDIGPMDKASEAVLALKPVTFHYKSDPKGIPQFGLVAEEVAKVNPDLVVRNAKGEIYTVRYDAVNAMLLNEFLKEHRKVEEQQATITQLKKDFGATIAQLTARLDEQASQIQKVSAQIEVTKPAPQTVLNNH